MRSVLPGIRRVEIAPALANAPIKFGDRVRVKDTEPAIASGFAGRTGTVFGQTVPSSSGVTVIGTPASDFALNVNFEEPDADAWFTDDMLERIGGGVPIEARIDGYGATLKRDSEGGWREIPD